MTKESLQAKQKIGQLMDSPRWAFLDAADLRAIHQLALLPYRHSEGSGISVHWPSFLKAVQIRIALRMYEQRKAHNAR